MYKVRYPRYRHCVYYQQTYQHYPCRDCTGKDIPLTCMDCRKYPCKPVQQKSHGSLKICENFI